MIYDPQSYRAGQCWLLSCNFMNEQTMSNDELMGLRQKIDEVDEKIQRLINERAGYADK